MVCLLAHRKNSRKVVLRVAIDCPAVDSLSSKLIADLKKGIAFASLYNAD